MTSPITNDCSSSEESIAISTTKTSPAHIRLPRYVLGLLFKHHEKIGFGKNAMLEKHHLTIIGQIVVSN